MDDFIISGRAWFDGIATPVLWVKGNKIAYCNPAAKDLGLAEGQPLPEVFCTEDAEQSFSVRWQERSWNGRKTRLQEGELIELSPLQPRIAGLERINQLARTMRLPLSNLYNTIQMLASPSVEQNQEKFRMYQGIQRKSYYMLYRMLENVELMCWLEEDTAPIETQVVDICGLCRSVVEELEALFQQAGCSITLEILDKKESALFVKGSDWVLRHMFYELLSNALRFAPKQGRIWVKVGRSGRRVRMTIGNSGEGFSSAELARAFDPTVTPDELTPGKGLGLGIAICRLIVERQGGRMALLSGKGGTVMIELPLCDSMEVTQLHSPMVDHSGGLNSALVQLSDALPWECFVEDDL